MKLAEVEAAIKEGKVAELVEQLKQIRKEKNRANRKAYYEQHKEKIQAYTVQYNKDHAEKHREYARSCYHKKKNKT